MTKAGEDKIHYLRIPQGLGARAEMVRMAYVLAGKPYVDVFHARAEASQAVTGNNPFKQFPFVETPNGTRLYQTHRHHGTTRRTGRRPGRGIPIADRRARRGDGRPTISTRRSAGSQPTTRSRKSGSKKGAPRSYFGALDEIYSKRLFAAAKRRVSPTASCTKRSPGALGE